MFLNLKARMAKLVLRLADEAEGPMPCKIRVTQTEMSRMIGVSRESINKQLRAWAQVKWVRLERGGIVVLKPDALTNLVGKPGI
jgi:CRP-like cAMP-binding protein